MPDTSRVTRTLVVPAAARWYAGAEDVIVMDETLEKIREAYAQSGARPSG
jgi:hypothetical protein